jgi:hypothetical protein
MLTNGRSLHFACSGRMTTIQSAADGFSCQRYVDFVVAEPFFVAVAPCAVGMAGRG